MAITYGQIRKDTLRLLDEFSSRGTVQPSSKVADYNLKIQSLVNAAIYDLASSKAKIPTNFKIMHNPVNNTYSEDTSELQQHLPGEDFSITLEDAKACFFEASYPGEIVIEESSDGGETYTEIETINVPSSETGLVEYKRLISPSASGNIIRLRFTGDYIYQYRNYVLYAYSWPTQAEVQQHRPVFEYDLPANFLDLDEVTAKTWRQTVPYSNYSISREKIYFNAYDYPMELIINYWRKPTLLTFTGTEATDDAQTIDLSDDAALIIPWSVAGEIFKSEKDLSAGTLLINQYEAKKANLITNNPNGPSKIENVTGW